MIPEDFDLINALAVLALIMGGFLLYFHLYDPLGEALVVLGLIAVAFTFWKRENNHPKVNS